MSEVTIPAATAPAVDITGTQRRADTIILLGIAVMSTMIVSVVGLGIFLYGLRELRRAEARHLVARPRVVTIVASVTMLVSLTNMWRIGLDLFASHSLLSRISAMGYGLLIDGGYAWQYNTIPMGGASAITEKPWQFVCFFILYPALCVSAYGLFKMKRWGYQNLVIFSLGNLFVIVGYTVNMVMYYNIRFGGIAWPVSGWWTYNLFVLALPAVILCCLFTIERRMFTR